MPSVEPVVIRFNSLWLANKVNADTIYLFILFKKTISVISIDIDPKKIELARNNAEVYGVADRIQFIVGDFFELAKTLKADAVFLSPPWGGPSYMKLSKYELEEMLQPAPLSKLLSTARQVSSNIALFLPRNSNTYAVRIQFRLKFISKSVFCSWLMKLDQKPVSKSNKTFWTRNSSPLQHITTTSSNSNFNIHNNTTSKKVIPLINSYQLCISFVLHNFNRKNSFFSV